MMSSHISQLLIIKKLFNSKQVDAPAFSNQSTYVYNWKHTCRSTKIVTLSITLRNRRKIINNIQIIKMVITNLKKVFPSMSGWSAQYLTPSISTLSNDLSKAGIIFTPQHITCYELHFLTTVKSPVFMGFPDKYYIIV